ncbi:hypothetical protein Plhal304r1_c072g0160851 [Plasmopara halstedii]
MRVMTGAQIISSMAARYFMKLRFYVLVPLATSVTSRLDPATYVHLVR